MHVNIAEIRSDPDKPGISGLDVIDIETETKLLYVYDVRLEINRQMLTAEVALGGDFLLTVGVEKSDHVRSISVIRFGGLDFIVTRCVVFDTKEQFEAFDNSLPVGPEREMVRVHLN